MIEILEKLFGLLVKPAVFLFQYFSRKPRITLSIKGEGSQQLASQFPGKLNFTWRRELVMHNDSAYLVRGIKLLRPFPKPWTMKREVPTRLEPDEKLKIPFEAHLEEDHQELLNRFGEHMQHKLGAVVFPSVVANVVLEFELANEHGRKVYQYSCFNEDGTVETEISASRRDNGT